MQVVVALVLGPLGIASTCFLVSLYFCVRMFRHIRPDKRSVSYFSGPLVFLSDTLYTEAGKQDFRSFQVWFRRFALWLAAWGVVVLLFFWFTSGSQANAL